MALNSQIAALGFQNVALGRRLVAIVNQLIGVQAVVKTGFGDIQSILQGLSGKAKD